MDGQDFKCSEEGCDYSTHKKGFLKLHYMKKHGYDELHADEQVSGDDLDGDGHPEPRPHVAPPHVSTDTDTTATDTPEYYEEEYDALLDKDIEQTRKELVVARMQRRIREMREKPVSPQQVDMLPIIKAISAIFTGKSEDAANVEIARIQAAADQAASAEPQEGNPLAFIMGLLKDPETLKLLIKNIGPILSKFGGGEPQNTVFEA